MRALELYLANLAVGCVYVIIGVLLYQHTTHGLLVYVGLLLHFFSYMSMKQQRKWWDDINDI